MKKAIILIIGLCLFYSCATTYKVRYSQENLDSYIGKTHQELVETFGAPSSQASDGADGYVLAFDESKTLFKYSPRYASKSSTLPKAQFIMDSNGICRKVVATNTDSVRAVSAGKTVGAILLVPALLLFLVAASA
jgi:hypothetical protein